MSIYKGYVIDTTEVHITGKFIIYKRGTDEIRGTSKTMSEAIEIIDMMESQTSFPYPDPEAREIISNWKL